MLDISVTKLAETKVHTIAVSNRRLYWVRMHDVQDRLGIKNMSDLIRKEIHGTKDKIIKYKRSAMKWFDGEIYTYVRGDLTSRIKKIVEAKKE